MQNSGAKRLKLNRLIVSRVGFAFSNTLIKERKEEKTREKAYAVTG
jgi:hypothetical protein